MNIVVDAMGGDYAPKVVIEGAKEAVRKFGVEITLVGKEEAILKEFRGGVPRGIKIHPAEEVIEMDEAPAASVRKKRNSSIVVGLDLVKEKKADAFFSAGNTGAVVCAGTLGLRLLPGIERPGIGLVVPTLAEPALLIDVGANIDPKPLHLLQYGIMADAYVRDVFDRRDVKVGLLNIGEEETKGTDFVKETYQLLEKSKLTFVGNVEAKDVFTGKCDVIVCDGFVGNVALKITEGVAEVVAEFLRRELTRNFLTKVGIFFIKNSLRRFKKRLDYSEYGGAPLLGVDGTVIIGHGRSSAYAIMNAIRVAKEEVERRVNEKIVEAVASSNMG
ncbi:MAG: phosphate acyltransferase PlsX [Candidatus Omnitrophota bacterium]